MLRAVVLDELVALVIPDVVVESQVRLIDGGIRGASVVLEDRGRKQLVMPGQPNQIVVPRNDP